MTQADAPALEVQDLRFAYPDGTVALHGISLRVEPGEKVALIGPNGSGKSTFLLNLNGIFRSTGGTVRVFGETLEDRTLGSIRARVGLLFSNPDDQLFSPTVLEDVAYGPLHMGLPHDEVLGRARDALAAVGMQEFEGRAPHHLSLGQKKRVAIATVLSMGTPLIALDEPTANLDPASEQAMLTVIRTAAHGRTTLIATHSEAVAALADRVVRL